VPTRKETHIIVQMDSHRQKTVVQGVQENTVRTRTQDEGRNSKLQKTA